MVAATALALIQLLACAPDKGDEDTSGLTGNDTGSPTQDSGGDTGTDDTGTPPLVPADGVIRGHVYVELYDTDEDGRRVPVSFDDAFGGVFPFGAIFVGAYDTDGDAHNVYHGDTHIASPSVSGDAYEMPVHLDDAGQVIVHAALDQAGDRIIQSTDPIGVYPSEILIEDGTEADDIDITIVVPADGAWGGSGGGGGGGGGDDDTGSSGGGGSGGGGDDTGSSGGGGGSGGGGDDTGSSGGGGGSGGGTSGTGCSDVSINGPLTIQGTYAGGDAIAMLADTDGGGPYDWAWITPTATADGATGDYELLTCADWGEMKLIGAWDSNLNNLVDPADTWGAYITAPDVDGNPVTIATSDLDDYEIQVPLGAGTSGIAVVPFSRLTGTLSVYDGDFDDLPAGTTAYVVALKYRPQADLAVTTMIAQAYDVETWQWADLTGQTSKSFSLGVPANTVMYLWAYADTDGDGIINESGEHIASGGDDDDGKLDSSVNPTGQALPLATAGTR